VQRGLVDAASVLDASIGPPVSWPALKLRVIDTSPDFAPPPVVAPRSVPGEVRARLQRYLLDRHRSKAGRQQLGVLGIDDFVRPEGISYQPLREMLDVVTATSD
jgi:ABC-type phosphate/phosphonate transport system substrate-binding protein